MRQARHGQGWELPLVAVSGWGLLSRMAWGSHTSLQGTAAHLIHDCTPFSCWASLPTWDQLVFPGVLGTIFSRFLCAFRIHGSLFGASVWQL